jgi:hypothetical protein
MIVFVVINVSNPPGLESAITRSFPGDHLQIAPTEWLIAARGMTAKDVSDRLGMTDATNGSALLFTMANYYGRAANNIWEWLSVKFAQP